MKKRRKETEKEERFERSRLGENTNPIYEMKRSLDWAVTQGSLFSHLGLYSPLVVDDFAILIPPFRFDFFQRSL